MQICGLDFTSRPTARKPITYAVGYTQDEQLILTHLDELPDFASFEAFLSQGEEWVGGFDFPFGLPQTFLDRLNWRNSWADYVGKVGQMSKDEWLDTIKIYRDSQPTGQKHPLRLTDQIHGGLSPLMVHGVPVGRMFFEGAPRLLRAGLSILPCHPTAARRVALEAYPGALAKALLGQKTPYKTERLSKDTPTLQQTRHTLLTRLQSQLKVHIARDILLQLQADFKGDRIDAVLCAVQVWQALAKPQYGIPAHASALEGWIIQDK